MSIEGQGHFLPYIFQVLYVLFFTRPRYQVSVYRTIGPLVYINYNKQESPMLHTRFCENPPAGSGKEDFCRVFTIYKSGGHLGHVTSIVSSDFHFLVPESFHTKFSSEWPNSF